MVGLCNGETNAKRGWRGIYIEFGEKEKLVGGTHHVSQASVFYLLMIIVDYFTSNWHEILDINRILIIKDPRKGGQ